MAEYFILNTGAKIPSIGLGTFQAEPQPGVVGQAVITAVKAGYRHIDGAAIYRNEKEIGLALKKLFDDGIVKREEMFITSKLWCTEHDPEDVGVALDSTLRDLQLDYLDLYMVHWPFRLKKEGDVHNIDGIRPVHPDNVIPSDIPGTWGAMEKLYDSGKARAIGVSNFSSKKLLDLLAIARVPPAVNQVECHPVWRQEKLRSLCNSNGVHLSGYSPLGSPGWVMSENILTCPVVVEVAEKLGKTPAQVALRWGVQMGHSVLPKSTKESRIKANLDVFTWSIPDNLFANFTQIPQVRLISGDFFAKPDGLYTSEEELWDGEI